PIQEYSQGYIPRIQEKLIKVYGLQYNIKKLL
ncbi:unnamed protein product, partial [marine sediment metagenome]